MKKVITSITVLSALLIACNNDPSVEDIENTADNITEGDVVDASDYENGDLLVDTDWLEDQGEDVVVVDVRREGFESGHIPGAQLVEPGQLSDPDNPVDGVLPPEEGFQELMQSIGVSEDTTVVAYDDGDSLWASRLFYALELYGHEDVRILNGGFTAWLSDEKAISTEPAEAEEGNFTAELNPELQSSQEDVEANRDNESAMFLDARSEGEFSGEDVRAERGGHIPGASHLEWSDAVADDGVPYFKDADALEEQFAAAGADRDKTVIPYCQTNVRGAHSYFSLRLLGFDDIKPYEGSWAEYGNDPEADIEG
ncbi:sulfurtransferase [Salisediminibacterium beveridgei]|uniref:thiosulfate sulfurtransferase n=1 Tax=Salisediminibacterium beveridgei TaxID=632773 RepID=A0A1D7QXN3_9BACI|nr:sulfurtransferase [Salisediminibacterium beveridgei]AOM83777.1 Thiosulfate sulfurtransferase, rhodanese [Salisediminibacterium beveridgei]